MKLFCFSYAGGSATFFSKWNGMIDKSIEVIPVEIPGRGTRFCDELCDNMKDLVDEIYNRLKLSFINEEYMLYGHSMGSWIVYYLTNRILKEGIRQPERLFLSGKEAPHLNKEKTLYHLVNDREFANKIYSLGGTPKELLENSELFEVFIPILKNDYKVIETCNYAEPVKVFDFDISIFNGVEDDLSEEDINEWARYTSKEFKIYYFDGGHFFIHDYARFAQHNLQ